MRSALLVLTLASGCSPLFGFREGKPRPICAAADDALDPMIDDMEDGDGFICESKGRHGHWYTFSDGSSTDLTPAVDFDPTLIPGGRGTSRYAAHLVGSGFTDWGAGMGFNLNLTDLARKTYDVSSIDGIKFWLKSTSALWIGFPTPQTTPPNLGGMCKDPDCGNSFGFEITAPVPEWVEYEIPFSALRQRAGGTATWDQRSLIAIDFELPPGATFDVWVDDIRFHRCGAAACLPTCSDPAFPTRCPQSGDLPSRCWPSGSDCVPGCNASNTASAPADGLITTFSDAPGGADITEIFAGVGIGPAESVPTFSTEGGTLHINVNAPAVATGQVLLVDFAFQKCLDASAFMGVQFSISGSLSGCTFAQATQDSAHLRFLGEPPSAGNYGSGPPDAHPPATTLTADQITSMPLTVMMPFATQVGGVPETPIDKAKLTWIDWVFLVDPYISGGPVACVADLVIDDVRFY
jgi:hypothetical protein